MARLSKEQLLEKKRAIEARVRQIDARDTVKARKMDAQRKIIAGAVALEHCGHDAAFGAEFHKLLDRFVVRDDQRALLGLTLRAAAASSVVEMVPATGSEAGATVAANSDTPAAPIAMEKADAA